MSFALRPQEAAFEGRLSSLLNTELVPELRRVLAAARSLPHYRGSPALAYLTAKVAPELRKRGIPVEALPLYREALAEYTATLGAEHEDTMATAQNLGGCLTNLGQHAEALPLLERGLAYFTQLKGEESFNTLAALQSTASVRIELGDLAGAEALLRQGQATLARLAVRAGLPPQVPPPGMGRVWSSFNQSMANLLIKLGHLKDAELLFQKSLATLAGTPEGDERNKLMTVFGAELGDLLHKRGDLLGAEKLYRELLPKLQGTSHYGAIANNLGLLLQKRGLVTESRKYLDIAKEGLAESFGAEHSNAQMSQRNRSDLDAPLRTCAQCGPVTDDAIVMKVCQGCRAARYCGPACSAQHWKAHKPDCRRIKAENEGIAAGSGAAGPSGA